MLAPVQTKLRALLVECILTPTCVEDQRNPDPTDLALNSLGRVEKHLCAEVGFICV